MILKILKLSFLTIIFHKKKDMIKLEIGRVTINISYPFPIDSK